MRNLSKPNIVLIVMDTARAKNFSCYGHSKKTTPFLDELAEENVFYTNAISNFPWTLPSHASLFTGKYCFEHEIKDAKSDINREGFLPKKLKEKDYFTATINNNGWVSYLIGEFDGSKQFDFSRYPGSWLNCQRGLFRKYCEKHDRNEFDGKSDRIKFILVESLKDFDLTAIFEGIKHLLQKETLKFIEKFKWIKDSGAKQTNKIVSKNIEKFEEPFFLFINYLEPHSKYKSPLFKDEFLKEKRDLSTLEKINNKIHNFDFNLNDEELGIAENLYNAEIKYLDSKIRELYEIFEENNLLENTVFIFTSDHGEYFGEHKTSKNDPFIKHSIGVYEEVLHVPLIIKYPSNTKGKINERVEIRELYYHILDLASGKTGKLIPEGNASLAEFYGIPSNKVDCKYNDSKEDEQKFAIYYDKWKYIKSESYCRLFNLDEDEKENNDLSEKRKVVVKKLEEKAKGIGVEISNNVEKTDVDEVDNSELKERLKKMGYLE